MSLPTLTADISYQIAPLFTLCDEVRRPNANGRERNLLSLSYGNIVRKDIKAADGLLPATFDGYNIVESGDTVLRLTDLQNDQRSLRTGLVRERGIITSAYLTLRPRRSVDPRYLSYALYSLDANKVFYGLGGGLRQSIGFDDLRRLNVPAPLLETQRRIADFLDDQTTRIDNIIAARQRQLELLDDRFESLVWDTFGFPRGTVEVPHSIYGTVSLAAGLSFVAAPADWFRTRLKAVTERCTATRECKDMQMLSLSSQGYLRPRADDQQPPAPESLPRYLVVSPGDLVLNPMWLVGGGLAVSDLSGVVSPDYRVFSVAAWVLPKFLHYVLRSRPYLDQYRLYTRANTTFDRRVQQGDMDNLPLVLPSRSEQGRIAKELDEVTEMHRATRRLAESQIGRLQEFKRSLISAAVSGEFDVSTASGRGGPA